MHLPLRFEHDDSFSNLSQTVIIIRRANINILPYVNQFPQSLQNFPTVPSHAVPLLMLTDVKVNSTNHTLLSGWQPMKTFRLFVVHAPLLCPWCLAQK